MFGPATLSSAAALVTAGAAIAVASLLAKRPVVRPWPEILLGGALATLVAFLVWRAAETGSFPAAGLDETLALLALATGVAYLAIAGGGRSRPVGAFVIPIVAGMAIASAVAAAAGAARQDGLDSLMLGLHATFCVSAYAALSVGAGAGAAYLAQETTLKGKRLTRLARRLPALATLDELSFRAISVGMPLLTLGIGTGSVWASRAWGSYWSWEPKLVMSLVLWLVCAAIFHLRAVERYQGRRTAIMAIVSSTMAMAVFAMPAFVSGGRHAFL